MGKKINTIVALLCILALIMLMPACKFGTTENKSGSKENAFQNLIDEDNQGDTEEEGEKSATEEEGEQGDTEEEGEQGGSTEEEGEQGGGTEEEGEQGGGTEEEGEQGGGTEEEGEQGGGTEEEGEQGGGTEEEGEQGGTEETGEQGGTGESADGQKINIEIFDTYVYFGSYPQREIVSQASDSGVYGKDWATENDYIIDASLYSTLKNLAEDKWNADGDTTLGEDKYRRIKSSDATYSTSGDINYYDWTSTETYHYFKFEPIKWTILEKNGNDVFLMSELALDDQKYNTQITNITWETGTIRSWLNGYESSQNLYGTDYSTDNFIDLAFTAKDKTIITTTTFENKDNSNTGTEGGNDTSDMIYLLSEDEVYGSTATSYGFASSYKTYDTARQAKSSTYAKAMGTYTDCESDYLGNCDWWLRTPGSYTGLFVLVKSSGRVYRGGQHANSKSRGVRPALHINISSINGNS